ncbi:hypothetical protein ACRALDRAFT_211785 [Sodiomyces alcalophilus JCM 7366]|uniref:uncharacterized protein n=1 Tax=Sodiomyces alcalophilus JCM 7366 TaxID=591952 RepID=UPI0039B4ECBE
MIRTYMARPPREKPQRDQRWNVNATVFQTARERLWRLAATEYSLPHRHVHKLFPELPGSLQRTYVVYNASLMVTISGSMMMMLYTTGWEIDRLIRMKGNKASALIPFSSFQI